MSRKPEPYKFTAHLNKRQVEVSEIKPIYFDTSEYDASRESAPDNKQSEPHNDSDYETAIAIMENLSDNDLEQLRNEIDFELDKRAQKYMKEPIDFDKPGDVTLRYRAK